MWKIGNRAVKITLFKPLDVRFVFLPQATDKSVNQEVKAKGF